MGILVDGFRDGLSRECGCVSRYRTVGLWMMNAEVKLMRVGFVGMTMNAMEMMDAVLFRMVFYARQNDKIS
jgi:hypothetical protein